MSDLKQVSIAFLKYEIAKENRKGCGNSNLLSESAAFMEKLEKRMAP